MSIPTTDEGVAGAAPTGVEVHGPVPKRDHVLRRLLRDPMAVGCLIVLGLIIGACILAPVLTGFDPTKAVLGDTLAPIGDGGHLLGGDGVGRDIWARLLYGGRASLLGAFIAVAVAVLIGVPTGIVAGYYRGWFDGVASWVANLLMALPGMIVLLVVIAIVGPEINLAMAVFGVLISAGVFRLIRASVTGVREELYVDAARVAGLSDIRIMRRHIFPVVVAPTVIQASFLIGLGIVIQAGLEFLGLGSATQPSWGSMLNDAFSNIYTQPSLMIWPGLAIGVTAGAFSLLGNSLRDVLVGAAPKTKRRKVAAPVKTGVATPAKASGATSPVAADELIAVSNLRVAYPKKSGDAVVVNGVSLAVRKGEVLGLVGESGSGKSQTAFSILGLLPADAQVTADRVVFDGTDLTGLGRPQMNSLRGRRIAYVPQEPLSNLDPAFRVGYQLVQPIRQHLGLSKAEATKKALGLLERVGIADPERVFKAYPHEISGGMAQRILIAGAVSCDPDLLIADEPTTALDVTVQAEVLDLMRSLQQERNMAVIIVTHDFGVVADICDHVAVMQTGRVVETATAAELFANPRHEYTKMLLDSTLEDTAPRAALQSTRHGSGSEAQA